MPDAEWQRERGVGQAHWATVRSFYSNLSHSGRKSVHGKRNGYFSSRVKYKKERMVSGYGCVRVSA